MKFMKSDFDILVPRLSSSVSLARPAQRSSPSVELVFVTMKSAKKCDSSSANGRSFQSGPTPLFLTHVLPFRSYFSLTAPQATRAAHSSRRSPSSAHVPSYAPLKAPAQIFAAPGGSVFGASFAVLFGILFHLHLRFKIVHHIVH